MAEGTAEHGNEYVCTQESASAICCHVSSDSDLQEDEWKTVLYLLQAHPELLMQHSNTVI